MATNPHNIDAPGPNTGIEERLRQIIDKIPTLVWSKLPDGSLDFFNQRFREYTGLSLEDGLGWGWINAFHPDDRAMEEWRAALTAGKPFEREARLRGTDGKYRWFALRAIPVTNDQGVITKWYGTSTDIDDRKQAEAELRQLVDAVPQHIVVLDGEGRRLHANETVLEYHGLTQQEFLIVDHCLCFHPDDLDNYNRQRHSGIASGEPWESETRLHRKDGQYRWFLIRANPLRNEQGRVIRWYLSRTDIEGRKQAERELQQLVDAVPQHMAVLAADGRILYANKVALDYHGYTLEEFLKESTFEKKFHPDDLASYLDSRQRGISSGLPFEAEARLRSQNGEYRWFLVLFNPLKGDQSEVVRWYATATDIEDRKRAEWEVRQLVDAVPQQMSVLAGDGRRLYANQVELDFHGCSLDELLDENIVKKKIHPDDLAGYWDTRQRGISRGLPFQTEVRLLSRTGEYRWFLVLSNPLRDGQGHVVRWYVTETDIEDRKQAENALRRSESYLAEAQRLSHTGSFAHDPFNGEITYWSEEAYRTFGFDSAKGPVSFREARSRVHPQDLQRFDEARERGIREKTGAKVDFRVVLPDGSIKHVHCVSRPFVGASGELVEIVGTNMDVTEQRVAQAALEKAFEEIKQLKEELYRENLALKEEIDQASLFEEIVGSSEPLRRVLVHVTKVAPADSTVLISGETGTGKELIARAIHKRSNRSARAFVSVNCAAIPATLIGSELFGHERGAFTGATQRRLGRFELAEGGTLFLDEVGDLPAETQIALLRVLQERQFERIGGSQPIGVNVRIITATNRNLKAAINAGTFRSDLFYRLNVFPIDVPPLRDRKEDIPLLVEYLTERYASKAGKKIRNIDKRTLELFRAYQWPGNIRELQNVIERAVILCDGETLTVDEVWLQHEPHRPVEGSNGLARMGADREKDLIESALRDSRGRVSGPSGAAAKLGIPRSTLETKIRSLRIDKHHFKSR